MKNCTDLVSNVHLHIRDGTSQASRLLPALDHDYFQLIDLRFHSLMAMVVDYAEMMKFYRLNNEEDGHWKSFFTADETVIIAIILSTDTGKLSGLFKYQQYPEKYSHEAVHAMQQALPVEFRQQLIALYYVAGIIDNWLVALRTTQNQTGLELHQLIESVIIGLGKELRILLLYFEHFLPDKQPNIFFSNDLIQLINTAEPERQGPLVGFSFRLKDQARIRSSFYAVIKAIEMVQARAVDLLSASLYNQRHDPAAGLLIAFLQLFQRLHQKINRFTSNYIDFYYEQVLGAQANPFQPDHTYLVVALNNKRQTVLIPKGTVFQAGLDNDKQEILFSSDSDAFIHAARVCAIHTLFFNRDPLNSPENILQETVLLPNAGKKKHRQLATECWFNTIPVYNKETSTDQDDLMAYPIFGAPKNTEIESLSVEHAQIGFIVASKTLLLGEGRRNISITLKFCVPDASTGKSSLTQWINTIGIVLKSCSHNTTDVGLTDEEKQDIFFKVFRNLFVIHVTSEAGWLPIEEYVPAYSDVDKRLDDNSLSIAFALSIDAPAVIPYSSVIHGEGYTTQLPAVRFILNPRGYLYPYSILNKLELDWVEVNVSVSGHRTLTLHNHLGQLSSLASFNPLGPLPEVGSYCVIGCAEAAIKQLTHFSVEIKWGGFPAGIGGFESYYQGYDGPNAHTDFKIGLSVLMEGKWFPEDTVTGIDDVLFQTKDVHHAANTLNENKRISCDPLMPYWSPSDYRQTLSSFSYTPSSKNGFFKFTLISPADAFGHKKYPQTLARVLTHNAKQRFNKVLKKEPNAPYTPVVTSILVNYQATSRITIGKSETNDWPLFADKLIHLHPMGWEDAIMKSGHSVFLLPQYVYSGNLLIGLEAFEGGGLLTLYFHLRENSLPTEHNSAEQLQWFFLSSNQWIPLAVKEIVSDSTHGFMTSGIVTLDVPATINSENTIMPSGFFWLCVSADLDMEKFCSLYSVYAQALKINRHLNGTEISKLISFNPLPAGSIKQAKQSISGLDNIWQVQPSVSGKSAESKIDVRIRVSERLRHKNRALLPIDYEQLILANFPQVYKVKCFANLAPKREPQHNRLFPCIRAGHVTIVLLPHPVKQIHYGKQLWLSGHLVDAVKDFIQRHTSPFVTVHFVNPIYETLQVRCTVKLKNGRDRGLCIGKLNEAISAYISPWHDRVGYTTHFGWRINMHDVQSYIQQLDFIDRVTNFSMLRITPDGNTLFDLFDSVLETRKDTESCEIMPKYPWSISEPMRQHFIEVDDCFVSIEPEITGIGELEIGSTFIVLNRDGKTK
ncbi:MAG: baseplate J/gp47 family protein [Burkholderiales bacterium]|nr:baseplate J/gp47 family protein [Burkholderiales bacterium]MDR4518473.1 hypothetical protein [Nitrosomonas sp.]